MGMSGVPARDAIWASDVTNLADLSARVLRRLRRSAVKLSIDLPKLAGFSTQLSADAMHLGPGTRDERHLAGESVVMT